MKKLPFIVLLCMSASAFAQTAVNVPGTKVMIVPPDNFRPSTEFTGLQSDSAVIQVMDLDGGNFYSNAATFSKKKFEDKGMKVLDYKETTVNGYKAKYAYIDAKSVTRNHMLVLGDSTFSIMLIGIVTSKDDRLSASVKKAMFTASYDKSLKVDHMANAFFSVDESRSSFKFAHAAANLFAFSRGGKMDDKGGEPVVLAMPLPATPSMTPESLAASMASGFAQKGVVVKETKNKWTGTVNGYDAYEAELYCESGDKKNLIYELAVIHGERAVVFLCMAFDNYETTMKEFKSLVKTVKFK
jgi:hypothetical protein